MVSKNKIKKISNFSLVFYSYNTFYCKNMYVYG